MEAFDLKLAMDSNHVKKLVKGDRLFIFEDKFFNQLIREQVDGVFYDIVDTEQSNDTTAEDVNLEVLKLQQELNNNKLKYMQNVEYSRKILREANIIKISLDGELLSILPFSEGITSSTLSNKLKNRLPQFRNEFVIVQNPNKSIDPLVSKFVDSNVAEIYLDGVRIAYIPL